MAPPASNPFSPSIVREREPESFRALLDKPDLVLDLLAFALSTASGPYSSIFAIRTETPTNTPTIADGCEIDPRLTPTTEYGKTPGDLAAAFAKFQKKGKDARDTALIEAITRTLHYGCNGGGREKDLFAKIEGKAGANVRAV